MSYAPYNLSYTTGGLYVGYAFMHHIKEDMKLGGKSMIIYCHQALKQESLSHPSSSTSQ